MRTFNEMIMKKSQFFFIALLCSLGCQKILDKKPDQAQVVPATLPDFQALLDNTSTDFSSDWVGITEVSAGDYYVSATDFKALTYLPERAAYTWQPATWAGVTLSAEWNNNYHAVFTANIVLDGLKNLKVTAANQTEFNTVRGQALFLRAKYLYNLAMVFAPPYEPATAAAKDGIPLRLDADLNKPSVRATLAETYARITGDLQEAAELLPAAAVSKYRAAKGAAFAELARVELALGSYDAAGAAADASLQLYNTLLDYNTLNATVTYPLPDLNSEVVLRASLATYTSFFKPTCRIDPLLYQSYTANDLRKNLFFVANGDGTYSYRGSYRGASTPFGGLATDEQYLIRAECEARKGLTAAALADLNTLLVKRWKTGTYMPLTAADAAQALQLVLTERRKELLLRGVRWSDLRRLNREAPFAVNLSRTLGSQVFTLPANDPRYTFPIPDYIAPYLAK